MMRFRMKKTVLGSPDGLNVYTYEEGREYGADSRPPLRGELADVFVREGWAVETKDEEEHDGKKAASGPSENKAMAPPKERKSAKK